MLSRLAGSCRDYALNVSGRNTKKADRGLHDAIAQTARGLGRLCFEVFEVGLAKAAAELMQMKVHVFAPRGVESLQQVAADGVAFGTAWAEFLPDFGQW